MGVNEDGDYTHGSIVDGEESQNNPGYDTVDISKSVLPEGYKPTGDILHSHKHNEINPESYNKSHFSDIDFNSPLTDNGNTLHVTTPDGSHESFSSGRKAGDSFSSDDFANPSENVTRMRERTGNFKRHK
jgi:hypothetical protein